MSVCAQKIWNKPFLNFFLLSLSTSSSSFLLRIAKNNALLSEWYMNKFLWTQSSVIFEQNCPIQINFFTLSFFVISLKNKTRNIFETRFSVPKVLLVANVCNNNHSNEYNSSLQDWNGKDCYSKWRSRTSWWC